MVTINVHSCYGPKVEEVKTSQADFYANAGKALGIKKADLAYNEAGELLTQANINEIQNGDHVWVKSSLRGLNCDTVRLSVMGPPRVGKSAITFRYLNDQFVESYDPTVEDTWNKVKSIDGNELNIDILDTAGLEDYMNQDVSSWVDGKHAIVWVYDITNRMSWQRLVEQYDAIQVDEDLEVQCVVFGNKKDLVDTDPEQRKVPENEARNQCNAWGVGFEETSARSDTRITEGFVSVIRSVLYNYYAKPNQKKGFCTLL